MGASKRQAGFTLIEVVIVIAIMGILSAVAIPRFILMFRRGRVRSAVQEVYSLVLATRMQAVKRNQPVVLQILINDATKCAETTKCAIMWVDTNRNFVQDAGEPTIQRLIIPAYVFFRFPGGLVNDANAVCFDSYLSNAGLTDMVVFLGDGTLALPQAGNSVAPKKVKSTPSYSPDVPAGSIDCSPGPCRGIYMTDQDARDANVFRISVDDFGRTGRASLLKWLPTLQGGNGGEKDYVPGPTFQWVD